MKLKLVEFTKSYAKEICEWNKAFNEKCDFN